MMRTEAEIRRAIAHVEIVVDGRDLAAGAFAALILDVLRWTLGEPSAFQEEMIIPCDAIAQRERKRATQ